MDILISIYPKYCQLIERMEKNYEFRPFHFASDKIVFWVYETKPTKQIKYKMTVDRPIIEPSESYPYLLGNTKFEDLISNGRSAYRILKLDKFREPISLEEMKREYGVNAPQNFIYLKKYPDLLLKLNEKSTKRIF